MKYIRRVLKYFVQITLFMSLALGVMMLTGIVEPDINGAFQKGWTSVGYILLMFFAVSLIYPRFGYAARILPLKGEFDEVRDGIVSFMEKRGYVLESEEGENLSFRLASGAAKAARFWEDRVTFSRVFGGFEVEGINKDIIRIISGLQDR